MQPKELPKEFHTTITVYFPGEPALAEKYENVREYTLGVENRVHFILEDGRSISTSLPFFLERLPRR